MTRTTTEEAQAELNDLVQSYEARCAEDGNVDLRGCLPHIGHPLYREARCELIRIDLECSWREGRPRRLPDYFEMFPDLGADRASIEQIAFEEYRLRVLAGENPSAAEYQERYVVATDRWPGSDVNLDAFSKTVVTPCAEPISDRTLDTMIAHIDTPPDQWDMFEDAMRMPRTKGRQIPNSSEVAQALLQEDVSQSCHEASFLLAQALTALPAVGTRFLKFQLIAELGRGGFGRVYLARQGDLANRPVALKITVDLQGEEEKLAQLQHTNVVPIFSVHKAGTLHAVCMPYFGPTTLADVIRKQRASQILPTSGASLVETLRARTTEFRATVRQSAASQMAADSSSDGSALSPTLKMLNEVDYVTAVLWLVERVTEGLTHAHEHGILHGDLKPANILLTDEAQPMLLDFNLSTDIKLRAGIGELRVGGTLPYMAPEQLEALQGGDKKRVDARSDVYSIGVILYELLTGQLPFKTPRGRLVDILPILRAERRKSPPFLRTHNGTVSPAVESLVRHCLEAEPSKRYQTACELHEDLAQHRQHFPLRHASEPSVREQTQKWVRRHPRLTSPSTLSAVAVVIFALVCAPIAWQGWQQWQADRQRLAGDVASAQRDTEAAQKEREAAQRKTKEAEQNMILANEREKSARSQIAALNIYRRFHAEAALARDVIDGINLVRLRSDAWPIEHQRIDQNGAACRALLERYRVLDDPAWERRPSVAELPVGERNQLLEDVAAILHALAQAEQVHADRLSERWGAEDSACTALATARLGFCVLSVEDALIQACLLAAQDFNARARACYRPDAIPRVFLMHQAELARLTGAKDALSMADAERQPLHEETDDWYWSVSCLAARGRFEDAKTVLAKATRQYPDHFGAWHLLALCHQAAGEFDKAEACFNTCDALRPAPGWIHYNRGLVCLRLGKWTDATRDFDRFIIRYPQFREAYIQRAAAYEGKKEYRSAIGDLTQAIRLVSGAPELYFLRAEYKEKSGDKAGAELDRRKLRDNKPVQMDDWIYRGMARATDDPKGALADFDQALSFDGNNVPALYQKALLLADRFDRPTEAVGVLNRVLLLNRDHVEARIKRGLLYAGMRVRDKAVADAELAIQRDPTPSRHYQAACIYALASREEPVDAKRAITLLAYALRNGYGAKLFEMDDDLQLLRANPEYRRLAAAVHFVTPSVPPRMLAK